MTSSLCFNVQAKNHFTACTPIHFLSPKKSTHDDGDNDPSAEPSPESPQKTTALANYTKSCAPPSSQEPTVPQYVFMNLRWMLRHSPSAGTKPCVFTQEPVHAGESSCTRTLMRMVYA